jgi:hypothetical protein
VAIDFDHRRFTVVLLVLVAASAGAQLASLTNVNVAKQVGDQTECAIAKNPADHSNLFILCNNDCAVGCRGLFAGRSIDYGHTWLYPNSTKTIADLFDGLSPAYCDPSLAWDHFGNLFAAYVGGSALNEIDVILSTDGGRHFRPLTSFSGSVDQPTITASGNSVWVVWNQGTGVSGDAFMFASGARVSGLGAVDPFVTQPPLPGTNHCSFGDVAISPAGTVVQVCQDISVTPASIFVSTLAAGAGSRLPNGSGPARFDTAHPVVTTNMDPFTFIPALPGGAVDSEAGLAYDLNPQSPHYGRLYLVYTDGVASDLDIFVRTSDDDGLTWSGPTRVNDDTTQQSQFFPRIASDPKTGNIAICWADCRNSPSNNTIEEFCTIATPASFPSFVGKNVLISGGSSVSSSTMAHEFGDYTGLTYLGAGDPVWGDASNSTHDNPDATAQIDAYSGFITAGASAGDDGDPHVTTINGTTYDFQAAGEFIALRGEGVEIQTRQVPVSTNFFPGPDPHDGLATCVSVNDAFAARVGGHRVTWIGPGDPNGPTLRVDGMVCTLPHSGIPLGGGGRITNPGTPNSIEIEFPDGTLLFANAAYWNSQGVWYMNIDIEHTASTDGLMGRIPTGSWLPALPDGSSLGPLPSSMGQRYSDLYRRFADSWRVTPQNTLFDYEAGTSTQSFTYNGWPADHPNCVAPGRKPSTPLDLNAKALCTPLRNEFAIRNCLFDVSVTGEPGFAKVYVVSQAIKTGATFTTVKPTKTNTGAVIFTATVSRQLSGGDPPTGKVQFLLNGQAAGNSIPLKIGVATFLLADRPFSPGGLSVSARYVPAARSPFLASTSTESMVIAPLLSRTAREQ